MVVSDTLTLGVRFNVPFGLLQPYVNSILSGRRIEEERYNRRVGAFFNKIMH
jgi:hypothetical protein